MERLLILLLFKSSLGIVMAAKGVNIHFSSSSFLEETEVMNTRTAAADDSTLIKSVIGSEHDSFVKFTTRH